MRARAAKLGGTHALELDQKWTAAYRDARLGKRVEINPGSRCALGFKLPSHLRLAPSLAA